MCDHCKTFKPLLEGTDRLYQKGSPIIHKPIPGIQEQTNNLADKGCCSWRRSCCSGGCCDQIGNCCTGSDSPSQNGKLATSYGSGYGGYGYSQPPMGMTTEIPFQMTAVSVEKVPCERQEKKLPMCFGGDCKDSECENDVSQAPRQSER